MENKFEYIDENIKKIKFNIENAKAKYRNSDDNISLMAVTKTVPVEAINYAVSKGIDLLGENRVQEYQSKMMDYDNSATVHFIGHLQTNKVKYIIQAVDMIQSVGSLKLAQEINRLAKLNNKVMKILCEVNIGKEENKSGFYPEAITEMLKSMSQFENIKVCGLMSIPPIINSDKFLSKMQELLIDIQGEKIDNINMDILSMGMTNDYESAIKYGSNLVRIGSGLFGARNYL